MTITFKTKVIKLEERTRQIWVSGFGENAVFRSINLGWFMHLDGSREALYVGEFKPLDLGVGDEVLVSIGRR
jgi:hypothetical protein